MSIACWAARRTRWCWRPRPAIPTSTRWWPRKSSSTTQAPAAAVSPLVKADLVFYETAAGGAVFSTGSIAWAGSLSHNGYDNNVSRIMRNVLNRFLDPEPF